jgi:hypothetical protein
MTNDPDMLGTPFSDEDRRHFAATHMIMVMAENVVHMIRDERVLMHRHLRETIFYLILNADFGATALAIMEDQFIDDLEDAKLLSSIGDMLYDAS